MGAGSAQWGVFVYVLGATKDDWGISVDSGRISLKPGGCFSEQSE